MNNIQKEFKEKFKEGQINEPLSKHSTFLIGGPADMFFKAKQNSEIIELLNFAKNKKISYFIIGGGSNILFNDKGFRGLIIKIESENLKLNKNNIIVDAGVSVAKLIIFALENGLEGLEKWIGLPGTVGGAVRGNAGCNGLETKDILIKATLLNLKTGEMREEKNEYFEFGYRDSKLKETEEIVLNAVFKLKKSNLSKKAQLDLIKKIANFRINKQPKGSSGGSFFKNPSLEKPAGMLIDKVGLKGKKIGKAQISEKHGNFLLNLGGACAKDIIELAKLAKQQVKAEFSISLKEEVQILSEKQKIKLT